MNHRAIRNSFPFSSISVLISTRNFRKNFFCNSKEMDQEIAQNRVKTLMDEIEGKLVLARQTIHDILVTLELQNRVDWPEIVGKFSSLSQQFSSLQQIMKRSHNPLEDNLKLMKMTQLVPRQVSLDLDPTIKNLSEERIQQFSHNVVPVLLRTKLKPEVEEDEVKISNDVPMKSDVQKQIKSLNSHVDMLCSKLSDFTKMHVMDQGEKPTYSQDDTLKLVRAVCLGKGIQPKAMPSSHISSDGSRSYMGAQAKSK